ncbi:MAG: hypothetical protein LBV43_00720 [Prevotella sp.]|jgi:hypothetical protein|nr:hypothetical protein [Prevotella sp.]
MNYYKTFFLIGVLCVMAYSCADAGKKAAEMPATGESEIKATDSFPIATPAESDTVRIDVRDGKGSLKVKKRAQQHVYLVFDSQDFKKMEATLSSGDSGANIRFARIIMPDGKTDGPFGATISRELTANGRYVLDVHENEMAGEPWGGDFEIIVSLDK